MAKGCIEIVDGPTANFYPNRMQDDFGQLRICLQQRTKAPEFYAISKDVVLDEDTYSAIS